MLTSHKKTVAVVVPMYKNELSESEKISMKHLLYFLGDYDKYFIAPEKLEINHPEFKIIRFNKKYFKNIRTYSKLLLTKNFYKKFSDYKYILIYQLDALVFSNQLLEWCDKGYDYIGAPWIKSEMKKIIPAWNYSEHCGNGGFSLRNVENSLKTLQNMRKKPLSILKIELTILYALIQKIIQDEINLFQNKETKAKKYLWLIKKFIKDLSKIRHKYNEDIFWSFEAQKYFSDFKVAPVNIGLKFAFEAGPKYCFKKNNYQLPFGCHAWEKYDKKFWLPHLLH